MMTTSILIVGDAPNRPTGLARIARDLASQIHHTIPELRVAQLAWGYDGSLVPWPVYPVMDGENWGEGDIERVVSWHRRDDEEIIVFTIWDPARCYNISQVATRYGNDWRLWGYFAIDGTGPRGIIGGPAGAALDIYERILGYGRWGAGVLKLTTKRKIPFLPHGIFEDWFTPSTAPRRGQWFSPDSGITIGCVAANQPRKDLALLFDTCHQLRERTGRPVNLWLHIDREVKYWSVTQLAEEYGFLNKHLRVTTYEMPDHELMQLYQACDVTIAPGLGEGFGYPIVESLASGVPVIHGNHGGGAELVPNADWLIDPVAFRGEGPYVMRRPVFHALNFVDAVELALDWQKHEPELVKAYCQGAVENLQWANIWPRWKAWIKKGM